MALDTTASNVALGQLQNLPFDNLIGGPLNAAIRAQSDAATSTVNFVKEIGLQPSSTGQLEAITLTFFYEDASGNFRRLTVPMLLVVPIPYIIIDLVNISFKAKITASASQSSQQTKSSSYYAGGSGKAWGFSLYGGFSSKKDSKATQESRYSVEYTMDVQVQASQAGIPQGMAEVLNILQDGIRNVVPGNSIALLQFPDKIAVTSGETPTYTPKFEIEFAVLDASGNVAQHIKTVTITSKNKYFADKTLSTSSGDDLTDVVTFTPSTFGSPNAPTTPVDDTVTIAADFEAGGGDPVSISRVVSYVAA